MTTTNANPQERIARETFHDAFYLGLDGEEAAHYWSTYEQAVVVIEADGTKTIYTLAETPCDDLGDWVRHTAGTRSWETDPRVSESLLGDLNRTVTC